MGRYRSRSYSPGPARRKRYDDPRLRRRDRRSSPAPSGLLVRNISLSARPEDLRVPFERFGPIKDVYLPKNYYTGEPRGFGFVKFRYPEDAAEAKENLNYTVIGGREIRIVFAEENRKTPHEMRRVTRPSGRVGHRRRSPSRSPRRRHHSDSRSESPMGRDSRDGDRGTRDDYSPRRSRSLSRSVSPRDGRGYKSNGRSRRESRSLSRSPSPHDERKYKQRASRSPGDNAEASRDTEHGFKRSKSPRGNSPRPSRSRSRS